MSLYSVTYYDEDCSGDNYYRSLNQGGVCLQVGNGESTRFELSSGITQGNLPLAQTIYSDRNCQMLKSVASDAVDVADCVPASGSSIAHEFIYVDDVASTAQLVQNIVTGATCDEINSASFEVTSDVFVNDLHSFPFVGEQCTDYDAGGKVTLDGQEVGSMKMSAATKEAHLYSDSGCEGELLGSAIDACLQFPDSDAVLVLGGRNLTKFEAGGLSSAALGGILGGAAVLLALAAFSTFIILRRKQQTRQASVQEEKGTPNATPVPAHYEL